MKKQEKFINMFLIILLVLIQPLNILALTIDKAEFIEPRKLFLEGSFDKADNMDTFTLDLKPTPSNFIYNFNYILNGKEFDSDFPYDNYWSAIIENVDTKPSEYAITASVHNNITGKVYKESIYKDTILKFEDKNFEDVIRKVIYKPEGDILKSDVEGIEQLSAVDKNIKNIEGIQNLTNLKKLTLSNNQISDISPLANLKGMLKELYLNCNNIENIDVLKDFNKLSVLLLSYNPIHDFTSIEHVYPNVKIKDFAVDKNIYYTLLNYDGNPIGNDTNTYYYYTDKYYNQCSKKDTVWIQLKSNKKLDLSNSKMLLTSDSLWEELNTADKEYIIDNDSYKCTESVSENLYAYKIQFDIKDSEKSTGKHEIINFVLYIPEKNDYTFTMLPIRVIVNLDETTISK